MKKPNWVQRFKDRARDMKRDVYALWFAYRDVRTPWYAKGFTALLVAYAFSPIDLIPDFIPVLGYLDDLILVPVGIALTLKMIPSEVMRDAHIQAERHLGDKKPVNWLMGSVIILIWLAILIWLGLTLWNTFHKK